MTINGIDTQKHSIVLYDGDCPFCNNSVNFIINRDPQGYFKFASLQSKFAQELISKNISTPLPDSLILVNSNGIHFKAKAAIKISKNLRGFWKVFYIFNIIPAFFLDPIYDFIARHRLKLVKSSCQLPNKNTEDRFL